MLNNGIRWVRSESLGQNWPAGYVAFMADENTSTAARSELNSFGSQSVEGSYEFQLSDANSQIVHLPSDYPFIEYFTIPSHSDVPFPDGTELRIINHPDAGDINVHVTGVDLRAPGDNVIYERVIVHPNGMLQLFKVTNDLWFYLGYGLQGIAKTEGGVKEPT